MKIVFATNNQHKLTEIRDILGESIEVLSLKDINCDVDIPETGKTLGENVSGCVNKNPEVIRTMDNPYSKTGGLAVLTGNIAPDGSVVKRSAVADSMLKHEGPARVFD